MRSAYGIHPQRTFVDKLLPPHHPHAHSGASSCARVHSNGFLFSADTDRTAKMKYGKEFQHIINDSAFPEDWKSSAIEYGQVSQNNVAIGIKS